MKALKPRSLAHRGHIRANGLIIPCEAIGLLAARRRVLYLWQPGAQVRNFDGSYLLLLPRALPVDCSRAPGEPLSRVGGVLTALPLVPAEIEALRLPVDCVVTARAGEYRVTALESLPLENVAGWFSVEEMKVAEAQSLGRPPVAPMFNMTAFDPRREMKAPAGSPELRQFLQALQAQKSGQPMLEKKEPWHRRFAGLFMGSGIALGEGFRSLLRKPMSWFGRKKISESKSRANGSDGQRSGVGWARSVARGSARLFGGMASTLRKPFSWFKSRQTGSAVSVRVGTTPSTSGQDGPSPGARMVVGVAAIALVAMLALLPGISILPLVIGAGMGLRQFFAGARGAKKAAAANAVARPPSAAAVPKPPGWFSLKLNRALARLSMLTRLSQLMGSRYARHIARVMQMMEGGDIDEALRNAIPLSDLPNVAGGRIALFSFFRPRQNLSISPNRAPASGTIGLSSDFFQYMRTLYRQTFQRLEAQGRIDEAAFVLSELLSANAEAVSFLEKHGRLRLAAELAEARNLPAPTVVRLWFLAGDAGRAIAVARRTGSFQTAIALMARTHPEEAKTLRVAWAAKLAESGKYFAAATTIWEVESGRNMAARWLDQAIELGGNTGAAALAKRVARFPDTFQECLPKVITLLEDEQPERALERLAFVEGLLPEQISLESRTLLRAATRSLVRDIQQGSIDRTPAQLRQIVDHAGESSLRADVPPVSRMSSSLVSSAPVVLEVPRHDVGRSTIYDCAVLPDGKLLLAMGEAGVVLCSREGKAFVTFNQPVYKLVLSDEGSRAIGIAQRGEAKRLCRLDLVTRSASYWCDAYASMFSNDFDGSVWYVAENNDVYVIDTLAPRFDALWRLPELGRKVMALQRSEAGDRLRVVSVGDDTKLTHWSYALPGHTLRSKQELPAATECPAIHSAIAIASDGSIYEQLGVFRPDEDTGSSHIQTEMYRFSGDKVERAPAVYGGRLELAASHGNFFAVPVFEKDSIAIVVLDSPTDAGRTRIHLGGAQNVSLRFAGDALLCCDDLGRVIALDLVRNKVVRNQRF